MTDLFDELKSGGETVIDRWIASKMGEDLRFDCKRKASAQSPDLDQNDKKSLAATISAFANSEGGLLLWGVDAREVDGVDRLVGKYPISGVAAFKSNVEHAIADLISPPVPGLEVLELPSSTDTTAGYLAIMVPLSDRRPHIARNRGERAFYFRNGHKSEMMEVYQVRDQMLRRTIPKLEFDFDVRVARENMDFTARHISIVPVALELVLKNNSDVSARFPYLIIRFDRGRYVSMGNQYRQFAQAGIVAEAIGPVVARPITIDHRSMSQDIEFSGTSECCIHPGTALRVASIKLAVQARLDSTIVAGVGTTDTLVPFFHTLPIIVMEVSYGCLDVARQIIPLEIDAEAMTAKLQTNGLLGPILLSPPGSVL